MIDAKVMLWGRLIGAVTWLDDREVGVFQYSPDFVTSEIQIAPLMMPLTEFPYEFPALPRNTFRGLPGLLADSLPDKFGNAIIDAWLASQGRAASSFNPVERLCYIGHRGMGALEYEPALHEPRSESSEIEVAALVDLANRILDERTNLQGFLTGTDDKKVMEDILRVGTSAGGARAKAILAWNPQTNEFRSGQVDAEDGFEHWLLKFDGIRNNRDKELSDPSGYGKIEYAYYLMAVDAGIQMTKCRLHHEGGRSHFMTKRFDRVGIGNKLHMQSLGALAHFDYNQPLSYSYEQALNVMKRMGLPRVDLEQQVQRAIFNVIGRNHDDHVKNISCLMNKRGEWGLSPAFDVTYSFDPNGAWTNQHQMSINGKRENFSRNDLLSLANASGIKEAQGNFLIDKTISVIGHWPEYAEKAGVNESQIIEIQSHQRIDI
jgi:serine/threonine-protein kinase HipA